MELQLLELSESDVGYENAKNGLKALALNQNEHELLQSFLFPNGAPQAAVPNRGFTLSPEEGFNTAIPIARQSVSLLAPLPEKPLHPSFSYAASVARSDDAAAKDDDMESKEASLERPASTQWSFVPPLNVNIPSGSFPSSGKWKERPPSVSIDGDDIGSHLWRLWDHWQSIERRVSICLPSDAIKDYLLLPLCC